MNTYDLLRGLHILAVIAWMAGILYLPRLFAYHADAARGSEMDQTFQVMERKLYRIIMGPAMVASFILGLEMAGVVFLIGWHHFLGASLKRFAAGTNTRSNRFWRATNELPFLAAIVMVLAVTLEFGG